MGAHVAACQLAARSVPQHANWQRAQCRSMHVNIEDALSSQIIGVAWLNQPERAPESHRQGYTQGPIQARCHPCRSQACSAFAVPQLSAQTRQRPAACRCCSGCSTAGRPRPARSAGAAQLRALAGSERQLDASRVPFPSAHV
eukprot:364965-Chlamydomonas_euryale.AAC.19